MSEPETSLAMKVRLRAELRQVLRSISVESMSQASHDVTQLIQAQPAWQNARHVLAYWPMTGELDIRPLIMEALRAGKTVWLPAFNAVSMDYTIRHLSSLEALQVGTFGIHEPSAGALETTGKQLDFTLVPGLGFHLCGGRLGRGKGFYDRLLTQVNGVTCGICLEEQVVPRIPLEPHDVSVNYLATPRRWVKVSPGPVGPV